jgi:Uma2 family endonuclease
VACRPFQVLDGRKDTLTDAAVIIDVLSTPPRTDDHGEKFRLYRALASFREYLLLAQNRIRAEHWVRQSDGSWLMREYFSPTDEIRLPSIGCSLSLSDVYERVEFDAGK